MSAKMTWEKEALGQQLWHRPEIPVTREAEPVGPKVASLSNLVRTVFSFFFLLSSNSLLVVAGWGKQESMLSLLILSYCVTRTSYSICT